MNKKVPMRRCVGCMESKNKKDLLRLTYNEGLEVDFTGNANGRGIYICPNMDCLGKAKKKKAFERNFKREVNHCKVEAVIKDYEEKNR